LERKGFIVRDQRRARTICMQYSKLPLKGVVQAGYLTEHPERFERVHLDGKRYQEGDYALQVSGDSMVGAQIFDGDIVVMRPTSDLWAIRSGQIAVIWIAGEGTTLKHVYHREDESQVTLKPANSAHPPRILERQQVGVQGVMVGHHRTMRGFGWQQRPLRPRCQTLLPGQRPYQMEP
jgi:repressor LexA